MSQGRLKLSRMLRLISLLTFVRMRTVSTVWTLNVSLSSCQVSQSTSHPYTVGLSLQSHIPVPSGGLCLVPSFQALIALVGTFPLTQVISSFCHFKKLKCNYVFLPSLHPSVPSQIYITSLVPLNFMAFFYYCYIYLYEYLNI